MGGQLSELYERNIPYVKQYDANGEVTNPIRGLYPNRGPNRKTRRMGDGRFMNNRKSAQIQVVPGRPPVKYRKVLQRYYKKDGSIGIVKHYLETK